jgi:transposase
MVGLPGQAGPGRQARLGGSLPGRDLNPVQRGASEVGYGRKGKGSTWHLLSDAQGLPLAGRLSSAADHGLRYALPFIDQIRVEKTGSGRAKQRPKTLAAGKGYDSRAFRRSLRTRTIQPIIPGRCWKNRKRRPGRPPGTFTTSHSRNRWKIERTHAWLANFRRLATRIEREHQAFEGFLALGSAMICLK